jgi:release factor glutamine methyltransferase
VSVGVAPGPTAGEILAEAVARLAASGVPEPRADAEVLLAHALGTTRAGVIAGARRPLAPAAASSFAAMLARRAAREPVQHVVGVQEFWSLPIAVDRRVLVPRPETELVVETALRLVPSARRVLDVGTGSGAVAAALARELPSACVVASDRAADALDAAGANLARLAPGVARVRASLAHGFRAGAFDLVVANLPYCRTGELARLAPEVRDWEPRTALDGGPDGLDVIRALVATAPDALAAGGWLVLEVGIGQAAAVAAAAAARGWARIEVFRDAAGIDRVVAAEGRRDAWMRS